MSIAFVVNNYPPSVGGVERHVSQLAAELHHQGHRVTVIALSELPGRTHEQGIDVLRFPRWLKVASVMSFPRFGSRRRITAELLRHEVDVVSTHTRFFPMSWVGARAARQVGAVVVHTEHGSGFVRGVSVPIAIASRIVDITLGRMVLRGADVVLGVSGDVKDFVRDLAGREATVFYNAIDVADFVAAGRPREPRFFFLGRLVRGKGWDTFLQALALLAQGDTEFTADIVGDGPDRDAVVALVEALDLGGRVRVHGRVEGAALAQLVGGGILVNPTVLSEGFQTSLIEALAARSSVVSFAVPGIAELSKQGAPVVTVAERTPAALAEAMRRELQHPSPDFPIDRLASWDWRQRALQFSEIARQAISVRRA